MGNGRSMNMLRLPRNNQSSAHEPEIHHAIRVGDLSTVEELIKKASCNLHACDDKQWTPLHTACESGNVECIRFLLDCKADTNKVDCCEMTPLHVAAGTGHVMAVATMVKHCRVYLDKTDIWGWTPLHRAVLNHHFDSSMLLLQHGCAVNVPDENKRVPLHVAASYGHVMLVKQLLAAGADINWQDARGRTPLYLATVGNHLDVIEELLSERCNPNLSANHSSIELTPLVLAADKGLDECAAALIKHGAHCIIKPPGVINLYQTLLNKMVNNVKQHYDRYHNIFIQMLQAGLEPAPDLFSFAYCLTAENQSKDLLHILVLLLVAEGPDYTAPRKARSMLQPLQEDHINGWVEHYSQGLRLRDLCRRRIRSHIYSIYQNIAYGIDKIPNLPLPLKRILLLQDV